MPASNSPSRVMLATAGVGTTPGLTTRPPIEQRPAESAASRRVPEMRVSRPMTKVGVWLWPRTFAAATPRANARRGVSSVLATPRTPSVPNSLSDMSEEVLLITLAGAERIVNSDLRIVNDESVGRERSGSLSRGYSPQGAAGAGLGGVAGGTAGTAGLICIVTATGWSGDNVTPAGEIQWTVLVMGAVAPEISMGSVDTADASVSLSMLPERVTVSGLTRTLPMTKPAAGVPVIFGVMKTSLVRPVSTTPICT